jgi:hypothetical protein
VLLKKDLVWIRIGYGVSSQEHGLQCMAHGRPTLYTVQRVTSQGLRVACTVRVRFLQKLSDVSA